MALTQKLTTASGGKSATNAGSTFSEGAAIVDVASSLFGTATNVFKDIQNTKAKRASQDRAVRTEQRSIEAADRAKAAEARSVFDHEAKKTNSAFKDDLARELRGVNKSQSAAKQGKVPQTSVDIEMETMISSLMAKYPDQESELLSEMKANGLDSYLIRAQQDAVQEEDAENLSQIQAEQASFKFAADKGLIVPGTSLEDGALTGRQFQLAEANIASQQKKVAALKANQELSSKEREIALKKQDSLLAKTVYEHSKSVTKPMFDQLGFAMGSVNTDADFLELQKNAPQALLMIDNARMDAKALVVGNESAMKAVDEVFDNAQAMITNVISGDFSHAKNVMRQLKLTEDRLGVDLHSSAPTLMKAKAAGLDITQWVQAPPPTLQDALRDQVMGFVNPQTEALDEALQSRTETKNEDTGEVISPKKDITEISGPAAITRAHIETGIHKNSIGILVHPSSSDMTPETLERAQNDFLESRAQISLLSERSANTQDNLKSRRKAVSLMTGEGVKTVYRKLLDNPDTYTKANLQINKDRVVMQKMLQGGQRHVKDYKFSQGFLSEQNVGEFDTFFNKDTGRYDAKFNGTATYEGRGARQIFKRPLKPIETTKGKYNNPGPDTSMRADGSYGYTMPQHVEDKLATLNDSLDFLIDTTEQDGNMKEFVGKASEVSLRNFYVSQNAWDLKDQQGNMIKFSAPAAPKLLPGVEGYSSQQIARSPYRSPDASITDALDKSAEKHNIPPAVLHAMAEAESGGQKDRGTVTSSKGAVGVMQIMPIFAEEYGYDFKDMTDPAKNIEASADGFGDLLEDFGGDVEDALLAYNAGPTRIRRWIKQGRPVGLKWQEESFPYVEKIMANVNAQPEPEEEEKKDTNNGN